MPIKILKRYTFGDMHIEYIQLEPVADNVKDEYGLSKPTTSVGLRIYPAALASCLVNRREFLDVSAIKGMPPFRAYNVQSLVQLKLLGDATSGYQQGLSLRNSATLDGLRYESQQEQSTAHATTIVTRLVSDRGFACEHHLTWPHGVPGLIMHTVFFNRSDRPLTLEMLASFSLGDITPFAVDDAPGRLFLHRFRSYWSAEGRHERQAIESLHLERSWIGISVRAERFGQLGSMPVRGFFPFAALEDSHAGVLWGAQLDTPGSWQMECYRIDDTLSLSGGLPDREFGHWLKTIAPGEAFASPAALVTTVQGDIDDLGARLVELQESRLRPVPASEEDLPVIFNEWCTTWGDPNHDQLVAMADRLKDSGVKYLVIDAGWYKSDTAGWYMSQGEWRPNARLFPYGLGATAQAIRDRGLIPGIWFEFEVVGAQSPLFADTRHILMRDGIPITASGRHFWDMRDPWVEQYLTERVIKMLADSGFGYIKVDYNETTGFGVDGAESPGEGLRQHMEGVLRFFDKMRDAIPDLVIENCSSGGHRLAPAFMSRVSQASFSDAHETRDIPIIAAGLHRLVPPRQLQIWAVLHPTDPPRRFAYLLAGGFLGRLCLSGEILDLSDAQWDMVLEAIRFYRKAVPVIRQGASRLFRQIGASWQHPQGAQAVLRVSKDRRQVLVVFHSFDTPLPSELGVTLPAGHWCLTETFPASSPAPEIRSNTLRIAVTHPFDAQAFLLRSE